MPDTDLPLLDEMAVEYAEFANEIGLAWLAYDGHEIHAPLTNWCLSLATAWPGGLDYLAIF